MSNENEGDGQSTESFHNQYLMTSAETKTQVSDPTLKALDRKPRIGAFAITAMCPTIPTPPDMSLPLADGESR